MRVGQERRISVLECIQGIFFEQSRPDCQLGQNSYDKSLVITFAMWGFVAVKNGQFRHNVLLLRNRQFHSSHESLKTRSKYTEMQLFLGPLAAFLSTEI